MPLIFQAQTSITGLGGSSVQRVVLDSDYVVNSSGTWSTIGEGGSTPLQGTCANDAYIRYEILLRFHAGDKSLNLTPRHTLHVNGQSAGATGIVDVTNDWSGSITLYNSTHITGSGGIHYKDLSGCLSDSAYPYTLHARGFVQCPSGSFSVRHWLSNNLDFTFKRGSYLEWEVIL
jgi:hypothetical protein